MTRYVIGTNPTNIDILLAEYNELLSQILYNIKKQDIVQREIDNLFLGLNELVKKYGVDKVVAQLNNHYGVIVVLDREIKRLKEETKQLLENPVLEFDIAHPSNMEEIKIGTRVIAEEPSHLSEGPIKPNKKPSQIDTTLPFDFSNQKPHTR